MYKNISFLLLSLVFLFVGCEKQANISDQVVKTNISEEANEEEANLRSSWDFLIDESSTDILFYDPNDVVYYAVQKNQSTTDFGISGSNITDIEIEIANGNLDVTTNSTTYSYLISGTPGTNETSVSGIKTFEGDYYNYFVDTPGTTVVWSGDQDPEEVSCGCLESGTDDGHCNHGGQGSTDCSAKTGAQVVGTGTSNECSTGCRDGYFACCNEEGHFRGDDGE